MEWFVGSTTVGSILDTNYWNISTPTQSLGKDLQKYWTLSNLSALLVGSSSLDEMSTLWKRERITIMNIWLRICIHFAVAISPYPKNWASSAVALLLAALSGAFWFLQVFHALWRLTIWRTRTMFGMHSIWFDSLPMYSFLFVTNTLHYGSCSTSSNTRFRNRISCSSISISCCMRSGVSSIGFGSLGLGEIVQTTGDAAMIAVSQGPSSWTSCISNGLESSRLHEMVRVARRTWWPTHCPPPENWRMILELLYGSPTKPVKALSFILFKLITYPRHFPVESPKWLLWTIFSRGAM